MAAMARRGHLPNSFMLSASSMQWFKKGESLVQLVGIYHIVLMSQTFIFPSSSYRFVSSSSHKKNTDISKQFTVTVIFVGYNLTLVHLSVDHIVRETRSMYKGVSKSFWTQSIMK
jgi:hypothetical protein